MVNISVMRLDSEIINTGSWSETNSLMPHDIPSCKVNQVVYHFHNIIKVGLLPCNRFSHFMIQASWIRISLGENDKKITFPFIGIGAANISNSRLGPSFVQSFYTSLTPYESFFLEVTSC